MLTWKKDRLQVSFQKLRDCWHHYQAVVKHAKQEHLSRIILSSCHKPHILFNTVDKVLNAPWYTGIEHSPEECEDFCKVFVDKVNNVRALISSPTFDPSVSVPCSTALYQFECVTLPLLYKIVGHLKPSGSPKDI